MGGGSFSRTSAEICEFNFFRSATLYKEYTKALQNMVGSLGAESKYDIKCNQHQYALYGGSGVVEKDGDDPTISYDSDITGKKGEGKMSEVLGEKSGASKNKINHAVSLVLVGLLFF